MWLNLRTEYSFGAVFGPVSEIIKKVAIHQGKAAGIADIDGTYGYIPWEKECKKQDIKPIYGIRLSVVFDPSDREKGARRNAADLMSFIALNNAGLKEIYNLVDLAYKQFYYKPLISYEQLNNISNNVVIIASYAPMWNLIERKIFYSLSPSTPKVILRAKLPFIACCDNWFIDKNQEYIYEPFADERKLERKTSKMHILTEKEWGKLFPEYLKALKIKNKILKKADAKLLSAPPLKYNKTDKLEDWCKKGAKKRGININKGKYKKRYKKELKLIHAKGYVDYFLVVADLIRFAKQRMLVGPSRGSSAGSLVCYLMGITEIDPLKFGLVFERFIDLNREDLPDIDIDFQDNKRHLVFSYAQRQYGIPNVAHIANINRLKPKSAIGRFAKALNIPPWETDEVKDSIVERSSGDARANLCIEDSLNESDVGKEFIKDYPNMLSVAKVEAHASHIGVHAAGILICSKPISDYTGVNSREKQPSAMLDKKGAEHINLLKIDALGLRTLTIIAEICDAINFPYNDLYSLPLDDKKTFKIFKEQRLSGIFQFEGDAVRNLAKQMPIETIDDISALSALGRPGPLATGGATTFAKRRSGTKKIEYMADNPYVIKEIEDTFGVIIYQEQVMNIGKEYGDLSWEDVCELRKAMSKSKGDEFFAQYKEKFIKGAITKGSTEEEANNVWDHMNTMGSWSFNKSHAISYGVITYWCAYFKAHYPLEFAVASLNNAKSDKTALKLLRDLYEYEGIEYIPLSVKHSTIKWSIHNNKLLGGLTTINGIGPQHANKIIQCRENNTTIPTGIRTKLEQMDTPFKYLYPAKELYGDYYLNPERYGVMDVPITPINSLIDGENVCIIGMLSKKVLRDANESILVLKRGGKKFDGPTAYMNIILEDDTESVFVTIPRDLYEELGKSIAEKGKVDKDWYMAYGSFNAERSNIYCKNIRRITKDA